MTMHVWQNLVSDGSVRSLKYSFGVGSANTMAARLDDGSWLVVSPAVGVPASALDELAKDGPVSALVAPNAFHHMGQKSWRERFPSAVSYAPEGALTRLGKQAKGVPFRALGELSLPARVRLVVPDGMKAPDVVALVGTPEGNVVFGGDLISNTVAADVSFLPRLVFGLLGGGPGYRLNPVPRIVYVKDRAAWTDHFRRLLTDAPLATMLPAHGDAVRDDVNARTRALFA